MAVNPIPEGYRTVTPYLALDDASAAIEFYKRAFDATEQMRMPTPDGRVGHAELKIGDSMIMVSDSFPQSATRAPRDIGGTTGGLFLYVEDVDASFKQAVDAGATSVMEPTDMFWGDRFGSVLDPYGHHWSLATHTRDLSEEEIAKGAQEAMAAMAGGQ
jgi:PhnB protein